MHELSPQARHDLLTIAHESIEYGLRHGCCAPLTRHAIEAELQAPRAAFVTLKIGEALRGCIGSLEARRSLAEDVHENAYAAAFRDPRFAPLDAAEWPRSRLSLSVLSPPEALAAASEAALIKALRPGIDGLVLEYGERRGTFLPAVWEVLPEPAEFIRQLKLKAGLPPDFWAEELRVYRYTAASIGAE